ncbi:hypothetical protein [Pelagerythrobacter sp.]|uniref:CC_3452 family protein n=1 Tax=Pelagerythrobacter sp. TaxID=2800702 RepID=UPI0035B2DDE2
MTASSSPLVRTAAATALALVYSTLTFGALVAPSPAQAAGGAFYTAELAAPAAERTKIISGVAWQCQGTTCVAAKSNSRPLVICQRVARELGEVTGFTAKGEAFAAEDLARCNGN